MTEIEKLKSELQVIDGEIAFENIKYKQALEDVREIATNYFEECGVPEDYFKRNNYSWKQHQIKGSTCKLQQIIDKINEVLK